MTARTGHAYLPRTGGPDHRATAGNEGVYGPPRTEGDEPARARYYPGTGGTFSHSNRP